MIRFPRILVAGGGGFLGTALVERLSGEGYAVDVVDRIQPREPLAGVRYHEVDLQNAVDVHRKLHPWRWDAVVNLAGRVTKEIEAWDEGVRTTANHVAIAANLRLALPLQWPGRFVQISGMVVYGMPEKAEIGEDHPCKPIHHYGLAKLLAEEVVLAGSAVDRWVLRLPGLFSESRRSGALYAFVRAAREHRPIIVTASRPLPWDAIHLEDGVTAIVRSLEAEAEAPGAVNVGYGEPMDLLEVATRIARRTGQPVQSTNGVQHPRFCLAIDKARGLFHWPPCTFDSRLDMLWQAWRDDVLVSS
jgi:UDP-glucose 4-epimerase